jgi:hypothetical protein
MDVQGAGYTLNDRLTWEDEAKEFGRIAQETPELASTRERLRSQAEDPSVRAQMYQQLQQGLAQKQAMRAAYAKGYNPAAQRQAMEQYSDAQLGISQNVQQLQEQDSQRAMQAYGQIMQQRQKIQFMAQEARNAYIMGNRSLAIQALDSARRAEVSAQGVAMAEAQAKADATVRMQTALVSAGSTLLATKNDWFSSPQKAPAVQNLASTRVTAGEPMDVAPVQGFYNPQKATV